MPPDPPSDIGEFIIGESPIEGMTSAAPSIHITEAHFNIRAPDGALQFGGINGKFLVKT